MGTNIACSWQKAAQQLQDCSTRQPNTPEAEAALHRSQDLLVKLEMLPLPPKAAWKKLVQLQVPLQLGAAFTAATQHDWTSPATLLAVYALETLMKRACDAGNASNIASIKQQLQQSGMLQQLSAVLAAMTAELQAETAALAAGSWDAASGDVEQYTGSGMLTSRYVAVVFSHSLLWGFWHSQELAAADSWMWGCSGHAIGVMQLATAGLRHASSVVQHVLPAVHERSPQVAALFTHHLQCSSTRAWALCLDVLRIRVEVCSHQQQGQGSDADALQQLLPCVATLVVMGASYLGKAVAAHCARGEGNSGSRSGGSSGDSSSDGSSSSSSSSSRKERDNSGATVKLEQQQQGAPGGSTYSGTSSSSGDESGTLTPCQQQLLQLLGLNPEVIDWAMQPFKLPKVCDALRIALGVFVKCFLSSQLSGRSNTASGVPEEQQQQFEQPLWRLLPTVLLPCASSLLLPGEPQLAREQAQGLMRQLLWQSQRAMALSVEMHMQPRTLDTLSSTPPAAWFDEVLGALLQLTDRVLHQQHPTPTVSATPVEGSSGNISNSTSTAQQAMRSACAGLLLDLLTIVAQGSEVRIWDSSSNGCSNSNSLHAVSAVSPVSSRLVEYAAAYEAALRAVAAAGPSSTLSTSTRMSVHYGVLVWVLLPPNKQTNSMLLLHTGLCGPAALAQEQQQLYSLLSTLQKLRWCVQSEADGYCLAAGYTAVGLLRLALAARAGGSAAAAAADCWSADQQAPSSLEGAAAVPSCSNLPSLFILGRCLLQWAEQLQQQGPDLLLLGSGDVQHNNQAVLHEYSAAHVCIPGLRQGLKIMPGEWLESLAVTVREWVGGVDLVAHQQLTAAGCAPQQLQQQLDALLSAQQGTQQGLSDATLAALVQQLQATGAMLSSIAVPHFCNNAACANLSGPTEVLLVSGRSCICAGCRIAHYCAPACQRAAWKQHKPVCKALAAISATAATAGGGASGVMDKEPGKHVAADSNDVMVKELRHPDAYRLAKLAALLCSAVLLGLALMFLLASGRERGPAVCAM